MVKISCWLLFPFLKYSKRFIGDSISVVKCNGRNEKSDVLCFYWSRTTKTVFEASLFSLGESFHQKLCRCDFLTNFLTKWPFLTSTTQTLPTLNGENCSYDALLHSIASVLPNINAESTCVWWMGIFLAVLCRRSLPEHHHWECQHTPKAYVGRCYIPLSFQFQFALKLFNSSRSVNETLAFTQNVLALTYTTPRNASEMKFFIAKNAWIFHTPCSIHFTDRKNCWLNAAMSGWVVDNQHRHCIRG